MKRAFLFVVGAASVIVIVTFALFLYMKIDESLLKREVNPEIELSKINHWPSDNKIVFTSVATNKSNINWENVGFIFNLKNEDGSFLKRCETILFDEPFKNGPVDIEVICNNMPESLPKYSYEVKIVGEH